MSQEDTSLENILSLDNVRYVISEHLGIWVKFEVKRIELSTDRPHGIKYSFTLHNRSNKRIMGFDNAHSVKNSEDKTYDHWHRDESDTGRPYHYLNAEKLLTDFWKEVDKVMKKLEE